MKQYTQSEVDAVLSAFKAFNIEVALESNPMLPLTIYTQLYKWEDGTYRDCAEPEMTSELATILYSEDEP